MGASSRGHALISCAGVACGRAARERVPRVPPPTLKSGIGALIGGPDPPFLRTERLGGCAAAIACSRLTPTGISPANMTPCASGAVSVAGIGGWPWCS
jgi:hypothetical protein